MPPIEFTADDIITTDRYWEYILNHYPDKIQLLKTDVLYGQYLPSHRNVRQEISTDKRIWVTSHSDYPITQPLLSYHSSIIPVKWLCVNKEVEDDRLISLPLGITNDCDDSPIHHIYGNIDSMLEVMNQPKPEPTMAVYINFNINTFPSERLSVYQYFQSSGFGVIDEPDSTMEGRKRYLERMRQCAFVACPRGNGVDTHRVWEALYMGSVPIIIKHNWNKAFRNLRIAFIDTWEQVTTEWIQTEYQRITQQEYDTSMYKMSYWTDLIDGTIKNVY